MRADVREQLQGVLEGHYTIERELGRGAMATVFLATDSRHGRPVAVKLLPPEMATATSAERFLREIRITAALQHPNILTLLDSGAAGGLCWYVMPYVQGESLRDKMAGGPLPVKDAVKVAIEVAQALGYAHSQGIIHRDIKPENIMLSGGHAIVMDFGLARALGTGGSHLTATGLPIGTPAYMSPEQIMGEETLDLTTDLYSLGCVLYEMVTGRPPFVAPSIPAVMKMHMSQQAVPPTQTRSGVPAPMDKIVAKLLAKQPAGRYQQAGQVVSDLEMVGAMATLGEMGMATEMEEAPAQEAGKPAQGGGIFGRLFGKK